MSVTVTYATLGRNAVYFIVEVLRNKIADTQTPARAGKNWIFKSQPDDPMTMANIPRIILTSSVNRRRISLDGSRRISTAVNMEAYVYSSSIGERDSLADSIVNTLEDDTSADADGTSLKKNYLILNEAVIEDDDDYYFSNSDIVRAKRITLTLNYYGA